MARCGCEKECLCVLDDGDCTEVVGNGAVATPYKTNVVVDPDPLNDLECRETGLFVESDIDIQDTDCIDLGGDGTNANPLTADPILTADPCNLMDCTVNGLEAILNTLDTDCIDLEGCGTPGDPLTADPIISPDGGNTLECRANGLFSSGTTSVTGSPRALIRRVTATVVPPSAGGCIQTFFKLPYDTTIFDVGAMADLGGDRLVVPVGADGVYLLGLQEYDEFAAPSPNVAIHVPHGPGSGFARRIVLTVNGAAVANQGTEAYDDHHHINNCSVIAELVAGDIIEGFYQVHAFGGPTAPQPLGAPPLTADATNFLYAVRLA